MVTSRVLRRLVDGAVGRGFALHVVTIEAGASHAYDASEWQDALVVVTTGSLEARAARGNRLLLRCGDVLWLADLPLRELHNPGDGPTILVGVSRAGGGR